MMGCAEKMQRCHGYVEALEEERRKIQVFSRELPLCLELVTQAIETCRNQFSPATTTEFMHEQSECSEHNSGHRPVLEEFIPIKRTATSSPYSGDGEHRPSDADKKKSDWLRSAQLWNPSPDPVTKHKEAAVEVKRNGGDSQPLEKSNTSKLPSSAPAAATSSSAETVTRKCGDNKEEKDKDEQAQRKQRRCWSPELHRRFLHALQQLGGSHTATPKQIRELMKVEGLTNDEVKSHLQKYRLHTRRPGSRVHDNANQQAPQFLVVGGIWVPPADYAPAAALPLPTTVLHPSRPRREQSEHSHSPATSSSTHTTTASLVP